MSHKYKGGGKVLHELLLGKFLIGAEILFTSDNFLLFFCESCHNSNALLCVVVVPSRKMKTFTTGYLYGKISPCIRFFSFITFTQVEVALRCCTA